MSIKADTDKVLTSILQCRLKAITEEMGYTLLRTSRSPILNEARDFVTGLYDAKGRMMEQAEYIPVLAFALQPVCQKIIEYFGADIHSGDVFYIMMYLPAATRMPMWLYLNPFFITMSYLPGQP